MKQNLKNFTSGSQLLENFGLMFAAGLRLPFWITVSILGCALWYKIDAGLTDHESYLCWMRLEALGYRYMSFDPGKAVIVRTVDGGGRLLTWGALLDYPPMSLAWADLWKAVRSATTLTLAIVAPLFIAYYWYCLRFGYNAKLRKHLGGATLATAHDLYRLIAAHNAEKRAGYLRKLWGSTWWMRAKLTSDSELDERGLYRPYVLAKVPWPWGLEQSHTMLVGTTGTGKTVSLSALVWQIRQRKHRAVIFDLTGAFIERFYDTERDIILNPLDARCPQWSIFNECETEAEFTGAWEALVPHDGGTSEPFWVQAARMLGVETCMKLRAEGRMTNHALYTELMTADLKHVHKLVERTLADPITAPEAARMAESVRAVLNTNAKPIRLLPTEGPIFSIKRWMLGDSEPGSILFLSSRYVDMPVTRTMLTTWMDTALNTLMTMPRERHVRMWFLVDELGALHRLSALEKGLQTARNYGGAIVLGIHAFSKLKDTYGQNVAETLASLARTKLLLATDDRTTATFESDTIGHRQFREMEEGYSYGYDNVRDAVTLTSRRNLEPLVLPDDVMRLPDLHGYLRFPGHFPAAPITLTPFDYPSVAEPFIERIIPLEAGPRDEDSSSDGQTTDPDAPPPASGDGGTGHAVSLPEAARMRAQGHQFTMTLVHNVADDPEQEMARNHAVDFGVMPSKEGAEEEGQGAGKRRNQTDEGIELPRTVTRDDGSVREEGDAGPSGELAPDQAADADLTIKEAQQNFTSEDELHHHGNRPLSKAGHRAGGRGRAKPAARPSKGKEGEQQRTSRKEPTDHQPPVPDDDLGIGD